jgi:hypothetical protein
VPALMAAARRQWNVEMEWANGRAATNAELLALRLSSFPVAPGTG